MTISKLNQSFIFFSDFVDLPEIDMIFAISAKAQLDGDENYKQMKKIINAMIDKYGTGDILYGFEFHACFKIYVQKFKAKSLNQLISKLNNPILKSLNDLNELNQFLLF